MKTLIVTVVVILGFTMTSLAQTVFDNPPDRIWDTEYYQDRLPVPYPHLRKADVFFAKRVWRVIDLREKINHPLYYPFQPTNGRISLMGVILKGLEENSITAYSAADDEFKTPLSPEEVKRVLVKSDTLRDRYDPFTNEKLNDSVIETPFDPALVTMIRLKEDWIFDRQRSVLEVRILGMCPVREDYDNEGNLKGTRVDFWVYFPQVRTILVKNEVFNRFNDGQRLTYDDWFFKRLFSSYVIKESNVYDRSINAYAPGLDALLESERIENDTFVFEHDLWEY
jgi:gliding motility associated protien GldN